MSELLFKANSEKLKEVMKNEVIDMPQRVLVFE